MLSILDDDVNKLHLTPVNVAIAFSFLAADALFSLAFGLDLASSLIIAGFRCIIQLSIMVNQNSHYIYIYIYISPIKIYNSC